MKYKTKKILSGVMALSLGATILAGCNNSDGATNTDGGKVKLELFSNKAENAKTLNALITKFEKENPKIDITLSNPPEAETVIKTRLTKNQLPDLMSIAGNATYGELARAGVLHDFSKEKLDNIQPAYVEMVGKLVGSEKKGIYGVPYVTNANGVIYNKTKLKELGLKEPKTWDEFVAALETAKKAGVTPIYFTLKDAWTGMVTWNSLGGNLVNGDFATLKKEGKATFAKDYGEVTDKFSTLLKYGHKDNFGKAYGDGNTAFAKGQSLFYLQGNWAIPEIKKANPSIDLGVIPFPATNDEKQNKLVSGVDVLLTVSETSKHQTEAKKFIDFLVKEENAKQYINEQSAFSAVKNVYQEDPTMAGIKATFEEGRITSFVDHYYPTGIQAENLVQNFLLKGNKDEFLKKMDTEWDKVQNR